MLWINFLHLYQPPAAPEPVVREATEKSYDRILRLLEKNPRLRFTLNITGCLLARWPAIGRSDILNRLSVLARQKRIEITGTAAYHPILPLVDRHEVVRQIRENEAILAKYLDAPWARKGFFLPEMAYSPLIAKMVKKLGYRWLILDEIAQDGRLRKDFSGAISHDRQSGLDLILRSRVLSNTFVPKEIAARLDEKKPDEPETVLITGTDAELYGLRYLDQSRIMEKLCARPDLKTSLISAYLDRVGVSRSVCAPGPHSWQTTEKEYRRREPFNLWQDRKNSLHRLLWQLADLAYQAVEKNARDANYPYVRGHIVRGLASCVFWWASGRDLNLFSPTAWNPDEIERGALEMIRAIRSLDNPRTRALKMAGERIYDRLISLIWRRHWQKYWRPERIKKFAAVLGREKNYSARPRL